MKNKMVLKGIEAYINQLFLERYPRSFHFYNGKHTKKLVEEVLYLMEKSMLSPEEQFSLQIAAWFFDIAQLEFWLDEQHNTKGLAELIATAGVEKPLIDGIVDLLPPNYPAQDPLSLSEQLLSDAIRFYWSRNSYDFWVEALRQDTQIMEGRTISHEEWLEHLAMFMQSWIFRPILHHPFRGIVHQSFRAKVHQFLLR
ncbi:hypothetical protein [Pedobacter jamesrossensis]|uniref:Uncharacterized protein n=1 Tax=Pedobacter jamesrossensis TaxID=1908238 RepID=A0ABV8NMJ1_9SPHI